MLIKYELADGKTVEIEVEDSVGEFTIELKRQDDNESRKARSRKEKSIQQMAEYGIEIADKQDVLEDVLKQESYDLLIAAIEKLKPKQQEIVKLIYFDGLQKQKVARRLGVSNGALTQQLATIHKKLKEFLEKT